MGPVYRGGASGEGELLAGAYRRSLGLAVGHGLRSVAFPSISTGVYGYPIRDASRIALRTAVDYLRDNPGVLNLVRFVLFSAGDYEVYADALRELAPNDAP